MTENLGLQLEQHLPTALLKIIRMAGEIAQERGEKLYLVGGTVRDLLLGRANLDIDIVVEGDAPLLANLLAQKTGGKAVVHPRFGTAKLRTPEVSLDIATARTETYPYPGALPNIRPSSIEEDLSRRDFTINTMAIQLNPDSFGELIDLHNGRDDLENHLIRILHRNSFVDDATRILRALRYEQRLGFQLEPDTKKLLCCDASMLKPLSGDRIRHEVELVLKEKEPEKVLCRADELGVLGRIYPALSNNTQMIERLKQARSQIPSISLVLSFALITYHFTPKEGDEFIIRLNLPSAKAGAIEDMLELKHRLGELDYPDILPSRIYLLLKNYSLHAVRACALAHESALVRGYLQLYLDELRFITTSLNGVDLQQMGVPAGPHLGNLLRNLLEAKLDQRVSTMEEEESLMQQWLKEIET